MVVRPQKRSCRPKRLPAASLLPLPRAWPSGHCLLINLRLPILSPGVELLSGKEKELCAGLRLLPKHYLYIKVGGVGV
jgi:hypothetical protein